VKKVRCSGIGLILPILLPNCCQNGPTALGVAFGYGGFLHTDHAVRLESFQPHEVPATKDEPYLMDFKYIFDPTDADNRLFMRGESVTEAEVEAELGSARTGGLLERTRKCRFLYRHQGRR
jgi:hypothetical protein